MPKIFKNKKFLIGVGLIILLVGYYSYGRYKKAHQPVAYDTVSVKRGDLVQTVDATGKLESVDDVDLRFEIPGTVGQVNVVEGGTVKAQAILATLRLGELNAAVAQAAALLNQKLAGASTEDVSYYKAAMDAAQASYLQSKIDAVALLSGAQSAVETAKNNLKLAEGGDQSQIVINAYQNAVVALHESVSKLDDSLTQADNILAVDNVLANDAFKDYLSRNDISKLNIAKALYADAKIQKNNFRNVAVVLTTNSPHADVDGAFGLFDVAFNKMNQLLIAVSDVLTATPPVSNLTQAALDAKKTIIETARAALSSEYATMINQKQSLADAKTSLEAYSAAYTKALRDLESAKANASTSVQLKEAAYTQALSTYQTKVNPPREVDIAPLRAALSQAVANREKAIIRAPFDGQVTKISKKVGETVSSADIIMNMFSPHFEIKVDVPETDVAKLIGNNGNAVTFTVDALGEDQKFNGQVLTIEKKSTEIQDVVYYQVRIAVNKGYEDKPFKSGMTANVVIHTADRSQVLFVPLRAVRTRTDGTKYVRILENGVEKEATVKLGLKADENKVEIVEGLTEDQVVILGVKQAS